MSAAIDSTTLAGLQACRACKQGKRRCDKLVPKCSLCQRTGRQCDYGEPSTPLPSAADFTALQTRLDQMEKLMAGRFHDSSDASAQSPVASPDVRNCNSKRTNIYAQKLPVVDNSSGAGVLRYRTKNDFPAALFLDIDCFVMAKMQIPESNVEVPMEVLALLSQGNAVIDTTQAFFTTVHLWMPIVSKKRMDLGIPAQDAGLDFALLVLVMKLNITPPDDSGTNDLYRMSKSFLADLEHHGTVSFIFLQALILLALYEFTHAIYPAAWMTVGNCARYANMLGISCMGTDEHWAKRNTTWTEMEERRRAWWAIFILDRLVSLGSGRSCLLPHPPLDARLPVDDAAWESGDIAYAISHAVSTSYQTPQSPYARLCQAAMYVDRVARSVSDMRPTETSTTSPIMDIVEEILGFCNVANTPHTFLNQGALLQFRSAQLVSQSAIFAALDIFTCPEKLSPGAGYSTSSTAKTPIEIDQQIYAHAKIHAACAYVHTVCSEILYPLSTAVDDSARLNAQLSQMSPLVLPAVYCTISTLYWYVGENGSTIYMDQIKDLDTFLRIVSKRWSLAGTYADLARHWDISKRMNFP